MYYLDLEQVVLLCTPGCVNNVDELPPGATANMVCPECGGRVREVTRYQSFKLFPGLGLNFMFKKKGTLWVEYEGSTEVYMLVQVGTGLFQMVNIKSGNRMWSEPSGNAYQVLCGFKQVRGWCLELHQEVEEV